jgi:TRAP-type C4-dicarboxylate transport system substrate-binding protein
MISSGATGYDMKVWENLTHFYQVDAWMPRNHVFVNKDVWEGVSEANRNAIRGCASLAAFAGHGRAMHYTDFTLKGLEEGGMTVQPAGEQLGQQLDEIGQTMVDEWSASAGEEGKAIIDAYKGS